MKEDKRISIIQALIDAIENNKCRCRKYENEISEAKALIATMRWEQEIMDDLMIDKDNTNEGKTISNNKKRE